jgi:hypothetical protein
MSRTLDVQAELRRLAHTLDVEPTALTMLEGVPVEDLRTLRAQIGEAMFQAGRPAFARVATLSKTVPGAVAAKLTELALPPLLAARTAELLEPGRAVDMVKRLSDGYLADVSARLDPARAPEVVAAIPTDRVATISAELARRGEWVVIGGFVAHVSPEALRASVAAFSGRDLLWVSYHLQDRSRVDEITALLDDDQLDDMIAAAAREEQWPLLADVVANTSDTHAPRLRARLAAAPAGIRAAAPADIRAWAGA